MPLIALALAAIVGFCITSVFIANPLSRPFETIGLSLLFGLACVPAGLLVASAIPSVPPLVTAAVFAVLIGCLALFFKRTGNATRAVAPSRTLVVGVGLLLGVSTIVASVASASASLGWDGLLVWELKAHAICLNNGMLPLGLFTDSSVGFAHPNYPLLQPLADAWMSAWMASCDEQAAKIVPIVLLVASCAVIAGGVYDFTGNAEASVFAAALPLTVPFLYVDEGSASSGYADIGLGAYYVASVILLAQWTRASGRATRTLICAGLLAAFLIWSKQEGAVYWAVLGIALGAVCVARRDLLPLLIWATPGLLVLTAWSLFLRGLGTVSGYDFMPITLSNIAANAGRVPELLSLLLVELLTFSRWGLLWVVALALCALQTPRGSGNRLALIWFVACPLVIWTLVYTLSAWVPYTDHVRVSLPRLVLQLVPTTLLLVALRVHDTWTAVDSRARVAVSSA
jgi:hypothetical protein